MDDLISSFNRCNVREPYQRLVEIKKLVEHALSNDLQFFELNEIIIKTEEFKNYLIGNVSLDENEYENHFIKYATRQCMKYYNLSFDGTIKQRLVHNLNMYIYIQILADN